MASDRAIAIAIARNPAPKHEVTKNEIQGLTILKLETRVGGSRASQ